MIWNLSHYQLLHGFMFRQMHVNSDAMERTKA